MELKTSYEIKIENILEKFNTKQHIEIVEYLLEYDKVREKIEEDILENSSYVDDLKAEITEYQNEIEELKNKTKEYRFYILLYPSEIPQLQKIKEKNHSGFQYIVDYTYYDKYFVSLIIKDLRLIFKLSKEVDFRFIDQRPAKAKRIIDSSFKNY